MSRIFYSKLVSRCYHLVGISSGPSRSFLEAYLQRFLVEDMKRILRAKKSAGSQQSQGPLIAIPKPYEYHVDLKAMSEAPTLEEVIDLLSNTKFKRISSLMQFYSKYGYFSLIEAFLDKIYYNFEIYVRLDQMSDKKSMEDVVAIEMDLTNLKLVLDLRGRGVTSDVLQNVSLRPMKLKAGEIKLMTEGNLDAIPEILSRSQYANLSELIRDVLDVGKDESLDRVIRSEIHRRTKALMIRYADTFAYVIGYVREAEAEANNLVSIVTGKELGLSEAKIETMLSI